ncbi:hypothetical protein DFJ74DRAFT_669593 [Hyaloraphidium curvatum]|nr:hypothetical protein DFJ74DRAFT_669593 [Hyaloraphidium curvatum]
MSFLGFGKKKPNKEAEAAQREELFKPSKPAPAPEPISTAKAPSKSAPSSASSAKSPDRAPTAGSAASLPAPRTYASQQEQYDALVAERRGLDQASLESTRRSVNRIAEAEMLAAGNLGKLSTQGEQLARTERRLDDAAGHAKVSEARTNDLTRLQAAFFVPVVTTTDKPGFSAAAGTPGMTKKEMDRMEQEARRKGTMGTMTDHYQGADNQAARLKTATTGKKSAYEMDDKAINQEIDQNLSAISGSVARLKAMSLVMNDEIDSQNERLERMGVKADAVKSSVDTSKVKLERIIGGPVKK